MKDYYKTLGIRATASPEQIHARWIELMRKFHPDRGRIEHEKARKINEAYEVLKHPSARAHYDLERTYHRKKRNLYLQRMILPPAILIGLLIVALLYLRKPWGTPQPESTITSARAFITNILNDLNIPKGPNVLNAPNDPNELDDLNAPNVPNELNDPNHPNALNALNDLNAPNDLNALNDPNALNALNDPNELNDLNQPGVAKAKTSAKVPKAVTASNKPKAPLAPSALNVPNELNDPNDSNALNAPNELNAPSDSNVLNALNDPNELNVPNHPNLLSQLTPPSLVATEEEVERFFVQYRERYDQMDIDGFLSLFSSKVVQNGTDGFEEIKTIYSEFFDESQNLRYRIEDSRIEIYQNAVEVQARYEIDQTLKGKQKAKVWRGYIRWILLRENGELKIRFLDFRPLESP